MRFPKNTKVDDKQNCISLKSKHQLTPINVFRTNRTASNDNHDSNETKENVTHQTYIDLIQHEFKTFVDISCNVIIR